MPEKRGGGNPVDRVFFWLILWGSQAMVVTQVSVVSFLVILLTISDCCFASKKTIKAYGGDQTPSGIMLRKGDRFTISAFGTWRMGGFIGSCSVAGFSPGQHTNYNITNAANHGELICRVGGGRWQPVGVSATIVADDSGELFFSPNDTERGNNGGSVSVTIEYSGQENARRQRGANTSIVKEVLASAKGGTSSIQIQRGDRVKITASGRWTLGSVIGSCGPDGMSNELAQEYNAFNGHLHGKLAVKVAGDDGWYVIGSSGQFTADKTGHLMWMANDTEANNNSGNLTLKVVITRSGEREKPAGNIKTIQVPANTYAYTSPIRVAKGQTVTIDAAGSWRMGNFIGGCDADGMSGYTSYNRLAGRKHGILIAKVRGDDGWYAIGSNGSFRAESSGPLVFAPNDNEPGNNSGSLSVTVKID